MDFYSPLQLGRIATPRVGKENGDGLQEDFPQEQGRRENQTVRGMPEVLHRGVGGRYQDLPPMHRESAPTVSSVDGGNGMIKIKYEGSRVHKPWVIAEGEMRQLFPNAPQVWETDRIIGTFNLQREAFDFLLYYHITGKTELPKEKGR